MLSAQCRSFSQRPVNRREVLRYARSAGCTDESTLSLLDEVIAEVMPILSGRVCFLECAVALEPPLILFGGTDVTVSSADLCKNLYGCRRVVLFGATIGLDLDRLIAKYGRLSPTKGLFCQALGAERIESLCDSFCEWFAAEKSIEGLTCRPRFSPGYGDLPLAFQTDLFRLLDAPRKIGLSLNGSLLMSPSKSVTAIVGLGKDTCDAPECDCQNCNLAKTCQFASPREE